MSEPNEVDLSANGFSKKKILRKQLQSLSVLAKHENIDSDLDFNSCQTSKYLLISNAGLICEVSYEELSNVLSIYGTISDIVLIAHKPYALVEMANELQAMNALIDLNLNFCQILNRKLNVVLIAERVWNHVLDRNRQCIQNYCQSFDETPNGLILVQQFISSDEENRISLFTKSLFKNIENQTKAKSVMKNRLVKHFGYEFNYLTNNIESNKPIEVIPIEYQFVFNRLFDQKLISQLPDQLTINYYFPGHGIPAHTDTHSMCEDVIISVSIGSDVVMQFRNPDTSRVSNVLLPNRSVVLMCGESRYLWTHSITPSKSDIIVAKDHKNRLTLNHRKPRISLTFRKVKTTECKCHFSKYCDSQTNKTEKSLKTTEELEDRKADNLEEEYVHKVYDSIADHFSETRYKPWPKVAEFLNSLPNSSLVLDIGCGNGKYLNVNPNLFTIGCDRSQRLLSICKIRNKENNELFSCDCLQLSTLRNGFDACISIAVLHHLSSHQRRLRALQSLIDLLVINGTALVYVWAMEQQRNGRNSQYLKKSRHSMSESVEIGTELNLDVHQNGTQFRGQELLVPWNTSKADGTDRHLRYYHVFREGELESLVSELTNATLVDSYYDSGNWAAIVRRIR